MAVVARGQGDVLQCAFTGVYLQSFYPQKAPAEGNLYCREGHLDSAIKFAFAAVQEGQAEVQ